VNNKPHQTPNKNDKRQDKDPIPRRKKHKHFNNKKITRVHQTTPSPTCPGILFVGLVQWLGLSVWWWWCCCYFWCTCGRR
jgi:hypothetical protein